MEFTANITNVIEQMNNKLQDLQSLLQYNEKNKICSNELSLSSYHVDDYSLIVNISLIYNYSLNVDFERLYPYHHFDVVMFNGTCFYSYSNTFILAMLNYAEYTVHEVKKLSFNEQIEKCALNGEFDVNIAVSSHYMRYSMYIGCSRLCRNTINCTAWSYHHPSHICLLFNSTRLSLVVKQAAVSGLANCWFSTDSFEPMILNKDKHVPINDVCIFQDRLKHPPKLFVCKDLYNYFSIYFDQLRGKLLTFKRQMFLKYGNSNQKTKVKRALLPTIGKIISLLFQNKDTIYKLGQYAYDLVTSKKLEYFRKMLMASSYRSNIESKSLILQTFKKQFNIENISARRNATKG